MSDEPRNRDKIDFSDLILVLTLGLIGAAIGFGSAPLGLEVQRASLGFGIGGAILPALFLVGAFLAAYG